MTRVLSGSASVLGHEPRLTSCNRSTVRRVSTRDRETCEPWFGLRSRERWRHRDGQRSVSHQRRGKSIFSAGESERSMMSSVHFYPSHFEFLIQDRGER